MLMGSACQNQGVQFGKNAHLNSIFSSLSFTLSAVLHHKVHIVSELLDGAIMCVCLS